MFVCAHVRMHVYVSVSARVRGRAHISFSLPGEQTRAIACALVLDQILAKFLRACPSVGALVRVCM